MARVRFGALLGVAALIAGAAACDSSNPASPGPGPGPGPGTATVTLASLSVSSADVDGGATVGGTATLSGAAPAGGTLVSLSTSSPAATVPASLTVPAGASSAAFTITTSAVTARTTVTILGSSGGANRSATLTILAPDVTPDPEVPAVSLEARHDDVVGGDNTRGTIRLAQPAPAGGISLRLTSDDDALEVPARMTIAAGARAGTFDIRTEPVATERTATITVTVDVAALRRAAETLTIQIRLLPVGNVLPAAADDSYATSEDTALNVAAPGVLDNDTDADSDTLTADLVDDVDDGVLTLNADGSFTYTPGADFVGTDTFTYRANDGTGNSNTSTVTIAVTGSNDAPTITNVANQTIDEDTSTGALSFTVGDTETAAGSLTVSGSSSNATLVPDADIVFGGSGASRTVTVTPAANRFGSATITITVSDGSASANDTFTLTVTGTADAPVAVADSFTTDEDTAFGTNAASGVLANDTDADPDSLTASLVDDVDNGALVFNADGSFTYTPGTNFNGSDAFTYRANDGSSDSNTATVTITVNSVNDAPTISAIADQSITANSMCCSGTDTGPLGFTISDAETPAASLVVSVTQSGTPVGVVLNGSAGNRTVMVAPLNLHSGTATIGITVSDGIESTTETFLVVVVGAGLLSGAIPRRRRRKEDDQTIGRE